MGNLDENYEYTGLEVAIIGMAGKFPNADNVEEFWELLINSKDVVTVLSDEQMLSDGISENIIKDDKYVRRKGLLKNLWGFDGEFFGYLDKEVEIMDPQIRLLHEVTYEALEDAGYYSGSFSGDIGLYAGGISNRVWETKAVGLRSSFQEMFDAIHFLDKDFSCSRVSHKLDLQGPSISVSTACTSSLTAVHLACRGLMTGDCNIAIAGGYSVMLPENSGHYYVENSITSKDGMCRPFDADGTGSCGGDGIGLVVLKLLEDAIQDNDNIYAVIKGTAIDNDGSDKPMYTAAGIKGIENAIRKAINFSNVLPETINFVETHGTGTQMGDYLEVMALASAFDTEQKEYCYLSSHKPNIGYLGPASGIVGLIKAALSLKHRLLPATLNYAHPNPNITFSKTPFTVNAKLIQLENLQGTLRLRAAVNNIAVGGTNAHIILEEAPEQKVQNIQKEWYLLPVSAKSEWALEQFGISLSEFLKTQKSVSMYDVAYTLQKGRKKYDFRQFILCNGVQMAHDNFLRMPSTYAKRNEIRKERNIVFLLPHMNTKSIIYFQKLYEQYDYFHQLLDQLFTLTKAKFDVDIKELFFSEVQVSKYNELLVFTAEYVMAKYFIDSGINPNAIVSTGTGEFAAACITGSLQPEDAYRLLMAKVKIKEMAKAYIYFTIYTTKTNIEKYFDGLCILFVEETSSKCLVGVNAEQKKEFLLIAEENAIRIYEEKQLDQIYYEITDDMMKLYEKSLEQIEVQMDKFEFIEFWKNQLTNPICMYSCFEKAIKESKTNVIINLGPGKVFHRLIQSYENEGTEHILLDPFRNIREDFDENQKMLFCAGSLWTLGENFDFEVLNNGEIGRRISLPKYPFRHKVNKL
ncbi:type I polyketide synthase [Anaeromicropila populeti]|uniref:Acyl transferase domain-containing protein n=1 Tax=Anaeromicropila populeti TaxID=37658 RepID=A0A1I6L142_9FIRM|nr:polyketide synthase [Anaeromicropila populeti]SFR97008.1 Acyl transferase domain-containing protein [Anaeromicropila populeti]